MRTLLFIAGAFILFMTASSCSAPYLITSQDKLNNFPCFVSDTGVNVRIRNKGGIAFTRIDLKVAGKGISFSGLKKGEITCYKNVSYVWTNNALDILFSKQQGYVSTLMHNAVDHIGEKKIKHGYVTINVIITKSKKVIAAQTNMDIDSI